MTIAEIEAKHPDDFRYLRETRDINQGFWGPQDVDEDTEFECIRDDAEATVYQSTDRPRVTVALFGQFEPRISVED